MFFNVCRLQLAKGDEKNNSHSKEYLKSEISGILSLFQLGKGSLAAILIKPMFISILPCETLFWKEWIQGRNLYFNESSQFWAFEAWGNPPSLTSSPPDSFFQGMIPPLRILWDSTSWGTTGTGSPARLLTLPAWMRPVACLGMRQWVCMDIY